MIYDSFVGRITHPRFGKLFDVKMFFYRVAMASWVSKKTYCSVKTIFFVAIFSDYTMLWKLYMSIVLSTPEVANLKRLIDHLYPVSTEKKSLDAANIFFEINFKSDYFSG